MKCALVQFTYIHASPCTFLDEYIDQFTAQMSEIVGFELKPDPDTALSVMLEYGLHKHLEQ